MTPVVDAIIGGLGALLGSWVIRSERRHGACYYYRPHLSAAWLACASVACTWAALMSTGSATWLRVLLALLVPFGVTGAWRAAGQAWREHKARRAARIVAEIQRDAAEHARKAGGK